MEPIETAAELGERVRESRIAAGRSQADLARAIGIDRSALVRAETGDRKISAIELFGVSDALGLPLGHFPLRPPPAIASHRSELVEDEDRVSRDRYRADSLLEVHLRDATWLKSEG